MWIGDFVTGWCSGPDRRLLAVSCMLIQNLCLLWTHERADCCSHHDFWISRSERNFDFSRVLIVKLAVAAYYHCCWTSAALPTNVLLFLSFAKQS